MNKKFILALMLTTGMAFAQTGSSGSTPDQSSQPLKPAALDNQSIHFALDNESINFAINDRPDEFNSHQHERSIQFYAGLPKTVRWKLGSCS